MVHLVYRWCARQVVVVRILFLMRANAHETAAQLPHEKTLSWWDLTSDPWTAAVSSVLALISREYRHLSHVHVHVYTCISLVWNNKMQQANISAKSWSTGYANGRYIANVHHEHKSLCVCAIVRMHSIIITIQCVKISMSVCGMSHYLYMCNTTYIDKAILN